jgi:hypothetical protein
VVGSQVAGGGGSCWLVRLGAAGVPLSTRDLASTYIRTALYRIGAQHMAVLSSQISRSGRYSDTFKVSRGPRYTYPDSREKYFTMLLATSRYAIRF